MRHLRARPALLVAGVAALAGAVLVLWAMRQGPGLSPDSLKYLLLARGLTAGDGFVLFGEPHSHFPPGYPALLAAIGTIDRASLWHLGFLNAALLAVNAVLLARLVTRTAPVAAGAIAAALFVSSPAVVAIHAMAWSEPLFLSVLLCILSVASSSIEGHRTWAVCGALVAAATLTRYAGIALLCPVLFAIVEHREWPRRRRLAAIIATTAAAAAPLVLWTTRNALAGSAAARPAALHVPDLDSLRSAFGAMAELWGLGVRPALGLGGCLALAAVLYARREHPLTRLVGYTMVSYAALLATSLVVFDADTPLDTRILFPLHALSLVIVAPALTRLPHGSWIAALWVALGLAQVLPAARAMAAEGEGFNCAYWRDSPTLSALRSAGRGRRVYTNAPEWVAFETHLDARDLPAHHSRLSLQSVRGYADALDEMCAEVGRGAVLAIFDGVGWRWELADADELRQACPLRELERFEDGVLLIRR